MHIVRFEFHCAEGAEPDTEALGLQLYGIDSMVVDTLKHFEKQRTWEVYNGVLYLYGVKPVPAKDESSKNEEGADK